jgi:hypothetical protein
MRVNKCYPEGMITVDIYAKLARRQPAGGRLCQAGKDPVALGVDASGSPPRGDSRVVIKSVEGFPGHVPVPAWADRQADADPDGEAVQQVAGTHLIDPPPTTAHHAVRGARRRVHHAGRGGGQQDDQGGRVLTSVAVTPPACLDSEVNYWLRLQGKSVASDLTTAQ